MRDLKAFYSEIDMPCKKVEMHLKELCRNYRKKYHVYSMFHYDRLSNTIYICTTHPGYWIGKNGKDVRALEAFCNAEIDKVNELRKSKLGEICLGPIPYINIVFYQCCSA